MISLGRSGRFCHCHRVLAICVPVLLCGCNSNTEQPSIHGARIGFVLSDLVQIPPSSGGRPYARINTLVPMPDGSHRLLVNDMRGKIHVIQNGTVLREPFLDMAIARPADFKSDELFEQGVSTFAFHPDFAQPARPGYRKFYTFSTERPSAARMTFKGRLDGMTPAHHDVIAEWTVNNGGDKVDMASRREIMRIAHPLHDHVGGQIAFNPVAHPGDTDYGLLYIAVGDGGDTVFRNNQVDEWRTAQDLTLPLGKLLRIDPLVHGGSPYAVPANNPYFRDPIALPEIWASGLRNPQRFSWDMGGEHTMIIADIGQALLEELDVGKAGLNYGWSEREGVFAVVHGDETRKRALPLHEPLTSFTGPALAYGHHIGLAITGGFVYRGSTIPQLRGMYLFGDIVKGKLFATPVAALQSGDHAPFYELKVVHGGRERSLLDIIGAGRADLRLGMDEAGEIYVLTKQDGAIRQLSGTVPSELATLPVEHPIDLFEDSWWTATEARLTGTVYDILERGKRLSNR